MISRIGDAFSHQKRPLLVACLVAGDPDREVSLSLMREAERCGADIIEVVMPYSDPVADGPVMQKAMQRALRAGMTPDGLFSLLRDFRTSSGTPLLILTYANIVVQRGIGAFYRDARAAGADGVAVADVPLEEADPFCRAARESGIDPVLFVSQTTSPGRLREIADRASGFLYLVAVLGVTGVRGSLNAGIGEYLGKVKEVSPLPVVPGFGIGTPDQIRELARAGADGVIVGSAIVSEVERTLGDGSRAREAVGAKVRELASALR
ncbi:MAG: tryptophan synthase subunit alpha [Methanolinea sp.]|nr:tryptophan synthase subunit alpha [Methanolinea sp.]